LLRIVPILVFATALVGPAAAVTPTGSGARYLQALAAAKRHYEKIFTPSEAARADYITRLARLRDNAADAKTDAWQAIDAEIKQHPAPKDADSKAFTALRVGQWESPRHDYLYRADGTWTMLPAEPDITHGTWRIDGNQYFDTAATDPPLASQYTIILISKTDFIFTDQEIVFYETRTK
jgi:hypothetical protein